jgi:hypothetical protein
MTNAHEKALSAAEDAVFNWPGTRNESTEALELAQTAVEAYLRTLLTELPDPVCRDAIATALANDDRCAPIQRARVALAADPLRAVLRLASES